MFDRRVRHDFGLLGLFSWRTASSVARFRKINADDPHVHHDALEFADGRIVRIQNIVVGQTATVLQLPPNGAARPTPAEASTSIAAAAAAHLVGETVASDTVREAAHSV